ncbi:PQQ-dependent catabolism-associated CXXCW motif protein [Paracoccus aminovorans]|uniref:PQQ-dependent catabolism-associated CXXCW motif protein n=1 Tax=Paracoccus aminovorans TaxID=34004 RepID=UPI002B2580E9|nr:PQQ-dependent catabolism-associated CXXCW motif protein [Paracoccus aminovorans]
MTPRLPVLVLALALTAGAALAQVPEPEGFRGEPYRAPLPATLAGAHVIDDAEAKALHDKGVPFLDVLPRQQRPDNLPEGTLWNAPPHRTIPGAVWLYDTGYQQLAPAETARLADGLALATRGDKAAPVVIFCKADCWMSWNAAKRAVGLGYTAVNWYPRGIDGWQDMGGELVVTPAGP